MLLHLIALSVAFRAAAFLLAADGSLTTCSRADAGAWFNYPFLTRKERDNETGLDYFGARYYVSSQGRFSGVDPVIIKSNRLLDPQRLNRYAYVRNSPLVYSDPDGRDLVKGAKFDKRTQDALVELAKRADGRKLLERTNNLSVTIEVNHGKTYDNSGKEAYGTSFASGGSQAKVKDGDIEGKMIMRLNFELAERDRKIKDLIGGNPPKSDAALAGHELEHLRRAADGIDTQADQMEGKNREIEDAIDADIGNILKQKSDIKEGEAKAFVENLMKPNEPKEQVQPEKKPNQQ